MSERQHGSVASGSRVPSWRPAAPAVVDGWFADVEVQTLIGSGAMGMVYGGRQISLDRKVALKILPPEVASAPGALERFRREAFLLGAIQHDRIVKVHDFGEFKMPGKEGEAGEKSFYFLMEYIEGSDLAERIENGPVPVEEAMRTARQIAEALRFAHSKGCVHRDIKPANIFLTPEGEVKVGDFGVAKVVDSGSGDALIEELNLTMTGFAMGTANYAAPELMTRGGELDHRADLFGLGVTLYEMPVGEVPRGAFPLPSKVAGSPLWLDDVVTRLLQQKPDDRYQSAEELLQDLDESRPVASSRTRSRLQVAVFGIALLALAGGALGLVLRATSSSEPKPDPNQVKAEQPVNQPEEPAPGRKLEKARANAGNFGNFAKKRLLYQVPKDAWRNSLGMAFRRVVIPSGPTQGEEILFSIWETRRKDYQPFVDSTGTPWPSADWQLEGFNEGPLHPAVLMQWDHAVAFCEWLTERDRKNGLIGIKDRYRLPSDHEWSCAAGIGEQEDPYALPKEKSKVVQEYWGGDRWPPPPRTGNFLGKEALGLETSGMKQNDTIPMEAYDDTYPRTSPVNAFPGKRWGLHGMAGNVREWCSDAMGEGGVNRVLRGGSYRSNLQELLLISNRKAGPLGDRTYDSRGFRCVLHRNAD